MNNGEVRWERAMAASAKRELSKIEQEWFDLMITIACDNREVLVGAVVPTEAHAVMRALIRRGLVKNHFSTAYAHGYELTEKGLIALATHRADPIMDLTEEGMRDYYRRVGRVDLESIIRSVTREVLGDMESELGAEFARVLAERAVHRYKYCAGSGFDSDIIQRRVLNAVRDFLRAAVREIPATA